MSVDLSVFWVIFLILVVIGAVNSLLFKPLLNVMRQRELAVTSARALADKASADAAAALQRLDQQSRAARAEVHREMETVRLTAEARRAELLAATRADANAQLDDAKARLAVDVAAVRERLAIEAETLGDVIVARVLGRQAS